MNNTSSNLFQLVESNGSQSTTGFGPYFSPENLEERVLGPSSRDLKFVSHTGNKVTVQTAVSGEASINHLARDLLACIGDSTYEFVRGSALNITAIKDIDALFSGAAEKLHKPLLEIYRTSVSPNHPASRLTEARISTKLTSQQVIAAKLALPLSDRDRSIFIRLKHLHEATKDEDDQKGLELSSLSCFISFIELNPDIKRPSVTLTWEGLVRCDWRVSSKNRLAIVFEAGTRVRFFYDVPSEDTPLETDSLSGATSLNDLDRFLGFAPIASLIHN